MDRSVSNCQDESHFWKPSKGIFQAFMQIYWIVERWLIQRKMPYTLAKLHQRCKLPYSVDSTDRPCEPNTFPSWPHGWIGTVAPCSVHTVILISFEDGDWYRCWRSAPEGFVCVSGSSCNLLGCILQNTDTALKLLWFSCLGPNTEAFGNFKIWIWSNFVSYLICICYVK